MNSVPSLSIEPIALVFPILFVLIGLLGTLFWIWMIIDCATRESSQGNDKIVWILVIILTNVIGALIYFFVRKLARKSIA